MAQNAKITIHPFENDELLVPEKEENYKFENGELKVYVKPLSWNVYVFEMK